MPHTVEEIQEIVKLANVYKVSITPRTGGLNLAGLTIPSEGSILLDLKRIDRILEVNEKAMYVVVECGVTSGDLKKYLEDNYPELEYSLPQAPPSVSVVTNALIHGSGYFGLKVGINSEMIKGLEVVLPTGEILKTGSYAVSSSWFCKHFLPDLSGLFIGWYGTTGIVTKCSLRLFPRAKVRKVLSLTIDDPDDMQELTEKLVKKEVAGRIYITNWTSMSPEWYDLVEKPRGVPELYMYIRIDGKSQSEHDLNQQVFESIVEEEQKRGSSVKFHEITENDRFFGGRIEYQLGVSSWNPFGRSGYATEGFCLPIEQMSVVYREGAKIMKKHGFQYKMGFQPMSGGRVLFHSVIMYFSNKIRDDPNEGRRIRSAFADICQLGLKLGGVPRFASPTTQKKVLQQADPLFVEYIKRIKSLLDPNHIMNPKQWA